MKGKVLVVDDDPAMLKVMARLMEAYDLPFVTASGGFEAHALLQKTSGDIKFIITDMRMPLGDGFELLDLMKKDDLKIPILLVTGFADSTEAEAHEKGAIGVMSKPFDVPKLMELVESYVK